MGRNTLLVAALRKRLAKAGPADRTFLETMISELAPVRFQNGEVEPHATVEVQRSKVAAVFVRASDVKVGEMAWVPDKSIPTGTRCLGARLPA